MFILKEDNNFNNLNICFDNFKSNNLLFKIILVNNYIY